HLARAALGIEPASPLVLQLGRLVPRKGIDTLVRAAGELRRRGAPTPQLLIVGGESDEPDPEKTPEIGRLQLLAREEGIEDVLRFEGRRGRECLAFYYSAAD